MIDNFGGPAPSQGAIHSRLQSKDRQGALGRGLGLLLARSDPRSAEADNMAAPLPQLDITDDGERPTRTIFIEGPAHRSPLMERLQTLAESQPTPGLSALFDAAASSASDAEAAAAASAVAAAAWTSAVTDDDTDAEMITIDGREFPVASDYRIVMMDTQQIQPSPFVPMSHIDHDGLLRLRESIKAHGFLRPLVVMPSSLGDVMGRRSYWLISGERSWQVARLLGLERVPVRIVDVAPREAIQMTLADDWHIKRLPCLDRAQLCAVLTQQMGMSILEIAERLSITVEAVETTLALLELDDELQQSLYRGDISEPVAQALLAVEDPGLRQRLWRYTLRYKWNHERLERAVRRYQRESGELD